MNIVIYARYSTDNQNNLSVQDQLNLCNEFILKQYPDANTINEFYDKAQSGADSVNRLGYNNMLDFISNIENKVKFIIVESIDRLHRKISAMGTLYEICQYLDIKIISVNEGEIGDLHIGLQGTMNALFLKNLKQKTARGLIARAKEGRMSSIRYGYALAPVIDERGHVHRGFRKIIPEQAKIIQWIFNEYANGTSLSSICKKLNLSAIPPPDDGMHWRVNSLFSNYERREGILCCDLYRGVLLYNRTMRKTNPITGKSKNVLRPEHEWIKEFVPHLQIIDNELWNLVQYKLLNDKKEKQIPKNIKSNKQNRLVHPLTYLINCAVCDSHFTIANDSRYVCSSGRMHKGCNSTRGIRERDLIHEVVYQIQNEFNLKIGAIHTKIIAYFNNIENNIKKQNDNLATTQSDLDKTYQIFLKSDNNSYLEAQINSLNNKITKIKANIIKLNQSINEKPKNKLYLKEITTKSLENINTEYVDLTITKQISAIFKCFIDKIILKPKIGRSGLDIKILFKDKPKYIDFYLLIKNNYKVITKNP